MNIFTLVSSDKFSMETLCVPKQFDKGPTLLKYIFLIFLIRGELNEDDVNDFENEKIGFQFQMSLNDF